MKIGIISDTHDDVDNTNKSIKIFKKEEVGLIVHLGDFVSPPIARLFSGLKLIGVFGNNDGDKLVLNKAFDEINGELKGVFGNLEADNLKIALYHGDVRDISESLAKSGDYDAVFTGHWHKAEIKEIGKTLWVSFGSANRFFAENFSPTVGIFDTKTKEIKFIKL